MKKRYIVLILLCAAFSVSACAITFEPKDAVTNKSNKMDIRTMELPLAFECWIHNYQPIQQVAVSLSDSSIPAIIASPARGFYKGEGASTTIDDRIYYWSGEEWIIVNDSNIVQNHVQVMTADRRRGIFYIGVGKQFEAGQLLSSVDGGIHWDPVPGWMENVGRTPLVIWTTDDGTLFVDVGTEIYIGDISGETWKLMPQPEIAYQIYPFTLVFVNPMDSNVVFLQTYKTMGPRSTDRHRNIHVTKDRGSGLYSFIYVTKDRGKSWTGLGTPEIVGPRTLISPDDFNSLVSDDFFSWNYTPLWIEPLSDNGAIWTMGIAWDRIAWDEVHSYTVGYRSSDERNSWQPRFRIPTCVYHYQNIFAIANEDVLVLATESDGVYFSDDGGGSWSALTNGLPQQDSE